jgi:hypothetical protein
MQLHQLTCHMNRSNMRATVIAVAMCLPLLVSAQPTIQQIDGAPFAATMVAAPAANAVAFVLNARGVRNIWVTDSTRTGARMVTAFTQDDGQDITSLAFSNDGRTLYFVRGGGPNRAGEIPNPTSDPAGAEQVIWRVKLDGSAATRLFEGSSPTPSPVGPNFAFTRRGAVFHASEQSDTSRTTGQLFRMRGAGGSLRWSPNGKHLALVSNRGTHSFVGVFDMTTRALKWIAPSTWLMSPVVRRKKSSALMPVAAVRTGRWWPTISCNGAPVIVWSSRGKKQDGCISGASRRPAVHQRN